jgi:amidase
LGGELERHRADLKETVIWNIERGLALSAADVESAMQRKADLERRIDRFLERHDFIVAPVAQVAPFPVEIEWITEIEGHHLETYIDWMATCYAISCTGLPAISVPCGFTDDGLPVGLQIVGRRRRDLEVLELARAFERSTRFGERRPAIAMQRATEERK